MAEKNLLARDIMTRDVITVCPEDDVEKAARLLLEHHVSGLPVVDDAGKLVGIVSEADLVLQEKGVRGPLYTVFMGGVLYLENPRRFDEEFRRAIARKIGDLMSKKVHTVAPDDPMTKVAAIMADKGVNRVPVVDREQRLVGIVSRQDIIRASYGN
ncbi:MAG: CBS domain-containing protein [Thermoanaerobacterales bacterium]|nr:CBS domain-containing protein [Bacillota bacterium]MDI6906804.1 CBS domain-containing protein [Thermoanaerobacterales bacterium]